VQQYQLTVLLHSQNMDVITAVSHLNVHYHFPFPLQVNFVAAIDVYEDGEAGLLLCYNCKYLGKTENDRISICVWNSFCIVVQICVLK